VLPAHPHGCLQPLYLIRCEGLRDPDERSVRPIFESAFRELGLPEAIRSDNGALPGHESMLVDHVGLLIVRIEVALGRSCSICSTNPESSLD
jgi:hypothetical protein